VSANVANLLARDAIDLIGSAESAKVKRVPRTRTAPCSSSTTPAASPSAGAEWPNAGTGKGADYRRRKKLRVATPFECRRGLLTKPLACVSREFCSGPSTRIQQLLVNDHDERSAIAPLHVSPT